MNAKQLGAKAFAAGKPCSPAQDKQMIKLCEGRQVGDARTVQEMRDWMNGWMSANLAA